jgi:hypothetical protein
LQSSLTVLTVTLLHRLKMQAPGLTPPAVLEKLAGIQMLDVSFPTTHGRQLIMPRHTEPSPEHALLLHHLNLVLPLQPASRITTPASTLRLHGDQAIVETITETRRATAAAEASAKHDDTATNDRAADAAKDREREAAASKAMRTNDYIVKLVKGGLPPDIIIENDRHPTGEILTVA